MPASLTPSVFLELHIRCFDDLIATPALSLIKSLPNLGRNRSPSLPSLNVGISVKGPLLLGATALENYQ